MNPEWRRGEASFEDPTLSLRAGNATLYNVFSSARSSLFLGQFKPFSPRLGRVDFYSLRGQSKHLLSERGLGVILKLGFALEPRLRLQTCQMK